jgi:hypothetical protein
MEKNFTVEQMKAALIAVRDRANRATTANVESALRATDGFNAEVVGIRRVQDSKLE